MDDFKPKEVVSAIFAITMFSLIGLWCTGKLEGVGSFLSGVGTIGLLFVAVWQLPKYRMQKHIDRMEEISLELSDSAHHFVRALQSLTNQVVFNHEILDEDKIIGDPPEAYQYTKIARIYRFRLSLVEKDIKKFFDISWKARFLDNDKEVMLKIEELLKISRDLSIKIYILRGSDNDLYTAKKFYKEFIELTSYEELEKCREDLLKLLSKNLFSSL